MANPFQSINDSLDGVALHLQQLQLSRGGYTGSGLSGNTMPSSLRSNLEDVRQHVEQKTLERMLETVAYLDETQLYAEIERGEEALRNQMHSRREAEDALRNEVERLAVEVTILQKSTSQYHQEVEQLSEVQDKVAIRRHEEANNAKRQVVLCKRNADFTRKIMDEAQRHADLMRQYTEESAMLEAKGAGLRDMWEVAVQHLNKISKRCEDLEREKTRMEWELSERDRKNDEEFADVREINLQVKALVTEQQALQKELRRAEDAQELQQLLENERSAIGKNRLTTSVLIEQIAELEESGDNIERRSQAIVEELRIILERGASQTLELEHSKRQADEWVKAMWSTICQQKREQLLLHQRMKEEDMWTAHLQERTDALVEELRKLEEEVRGYEGPVGATEQERRMEEEMFKRLQKIREKRRGAQHILAINLARRKPMLEALKDAQEDEAVLLEKLAPLQHILGAARQA